jgi:hypothetical protein
MRMRDEMREISGRSGVIRCSSFAHPNLTSKTKFLTSPPPRRSALEAIRHLNLLVYETRFS